MNNSVIRDRQGIMSFVNSLELFIDESQRICGNMSALIEHSRQMWKDDTALAFQVSLEAVIQSVNAINPELKRRCENLEEQVRLIDEYSS